MADTEDLRMLRPDGTWDMSPDDDEPLTGDLAVSEQVARRYLTERGLLSYAPNDGTDVLEYLNDNMPLAVIRAQLEAEALKDERVESASVTGTKGEELRAEIELSSGLVLEFEVPS